MNRIDGREYNQLRPVKMTRNFTIHSAGSVLIEVGNTKVICTASVENKVPRFLKGQGKGWITAEYSMLPSSTHSRKIRNSSKGKVDGRTMEIQRLIGRSLRSVIDLELLGENTIWIDCDVIQADGGTRTASITGAYVALVDAVNDMIKKELIEKSPVVKKLAAVSVGIYEGKAILDLCYEEDSKADVDMNVVMTSEGEFIEVQGTGEERPFTKDEMKSLLELAEKGINDLNQLQEESLKK